MDNVDRMYRHLVRTVRARFPQYLAQPFEVGELHQTILPYRHHRRELGIETNEDYEIALTELLAGARDYLIVDERMRDTLRSVLASANPDPAAFKQFASNTVALSPASLRSLEAGPADDLSPSRVTGSQPTPSLPEPRVPMQTAPMIRAVASAPAPRSSTPPPGSGERSTPAVASVSSGLASGLPPSVVRQTGASSAPGSGSIVPQHGDHCRACDEELPSGRAITFCPHCGQNVTVMNCPACGSEMEVGWKFCATCGRPASR